MCGKITPASAASRLAHSWERLQTRTRAIPLLSLFEAHRRSDAEKSQKIVIFWIFPHLLMSISKIFAY